MISKPMLFSSPMVLALLRDVDPKRMTRRVVKPQPEDRDGDGKVLRWNNGKSFGSEIGLVRECCPHPVGSQIWCRETFSTCPKCDCFLAYRANQDLPLVCEFCGQMARIKWKPSIFMPRSASRITLEVEAVKVERLGDIDDDDAKAEGIERHYSEPYPEKVWWKNYSGSDIAYKNPILSFKSLWVSINGISSWVKNPWVWCYTFKRIKPL